ncbi:MAG: hypothetical protein R3F65_12345 [bacterium]
MADERPERRPRGRRPRLTPEARARRAVRELGRAAAELAEARRSPFPSSLSVTIELTPADEAGWSDRARALVETLGARLTARPDAIGWREGVMYCFQCAALDCAHARLPGPRHTFAGYPPTGKPTWIDFIELCLARRPEGLDRLFAERPGVVALAQAAEELTEGLLPGFGAGEAGYAVLGQVVVGLLPEGLGGVAGERAVMTVQVVETRFAGSTERLRLNVLGLDRKALIDAATSGAPRSPAEQLRRTLDKVRSRLDALALRLATADARGEAADAAALVAPLISRLRSDLSRIFNPHEGRTRHAEDRHQSAGRPTSTAWDDASGASDDRLYADARRGTVIVLGKRNRAHVFTREGRHVTSLRLEDGELGRKTARERWTPLLPAQAAAFRAAVQRSGEA